MGLDEKRLRIQLKTAEGELQYYAQQAGATVQSMKKKLENPALRNDRIVFQAAVEALIKEENTYTLYDTLLVCIGAVLQNMVGFGEKHPGPETLRFAALVQFLAPKLKSNTLRDVAAVFTKSFKILPLDLVDEDVKLISSPLVDPAFLQTRVSTMLGEDPAAVAKDEEIEAMKATLGKL